MTADESESDGLVSEPFGVETCQGEIPAMMFLVAFNALLSFITGMQPCVCIDAGCQLLVTVETLLIRNRLPKGVALGAMGEPLETGVCRHEFAG